MDEVRVTKAELLDKIRANREGHRDIFDAALRGYREAVLKWLEMQVDALKRGKSFDVTFRLPAPEDHTIDYDRAILMLEMEVGNEVVIGQDEFAMFVMDDWQWKRQFTATVSNYLGDRR